MWTREDWANSFADEIKSLFYQEFKKQPITLLKEIEAESPPESVEDAHVAETIVNSLQQRAIDLAVLSDEVLFPSANPDIEACQRRLAGIFTGLNYMVGRFQSATANLGRTAWRAVNLAWSWFHGKVTSLLLKIAKRLNVQSWSLGVTGGFPMGVSATITVTFAPSIA